MPRPSRARDLLATAGASAAALARLGLAGRRRASDGRPTRLAEVNAAWLERALAAGIPGVRVEQVRPLGEHTGTTARGRFALEGRGVPDSVFVKLPPPDRATRLFVELMDLGRCEVGFYRDLAPRLPVRIPRAHHVASDASGFALVLEDLVAAGAEFRDLTRPCDEEQAAGVVAELARLHGAFWASPRLAHSPPWLRSSERHPFAAVERFTRRRLLRAGLRRQREQLPAAQRQAGLHLEAWWERLDAHWRGGARTLIHGDPHLGNLYFQEGRPGFLDWQVAQRGDGFRDLAYFLVLSLEPGLRRRRQRDLLRLYLEGLARCDVAPMDEEKAFHRLRANVFYPWVSVLCTAGAVGLQGGAVVAAGLERSIGAFEELDPLGALGGDPGAGGNA